MFHLFNKVYLSLDFNLEPGNRIIISDIFEGIPFSPDANQQFMSNTYNELIDAHFGGDEEGLWAFLYNIPADTKFVVHVTEDEFMPFMLKYLRAMLPTTTDTSLYIIYRLTILRFNIILSQINYFGPAMSNLFANMKIMPKATFTKAAKQISKIEPFSEQVKLSAGIELLLAAYLTDDNTPFDAEFERRVENIVWKSIAGEIISFKHNLLIGLFNIDGLLDDVSPLKFDSATIESVISDRPDLDYLLDIDIDYHNIDHLKTDCDIDKIFEIEELHQKFVGGADDSVIQAFRKFANPDNSEADVRWLINFDMDCKFGSQLFGRANNSEKMNPYLITFFYDLARKKKMKDLKKYTM